MGNFLNKEHKASAKDHGKAYCISLLNVETSDDFDKYLESSKPLVVEFGGRTIGLSTDLTSIEEGFFTDHVQGFRQCHVLEFPSLRDAQAWHYQMLLAHLASSASGPLVIASSSTKPDEGTAHKVIVPAFIKAPPLKDERSPMLKPSLTRFHGKLLVNCALNAEHTLENKAVEVESHGDAYDFCLLISFPDIDQAKTWRDSECFPHLKGPLVALPYMKEN
jgi:uncharacterized protein (DUF1330 family)